MGVVGLVLVALLIIVVTKIWRGLRRPYEVTKIFEKQGIKGPPYRLFYGSIREIKKMKKVATRTILDTTSTVDITPRVVPHYHLWFSQYGETVLYWNGPQPRITVTEPELAKQIFSNKLGEYVKPEAPALIRKLTGTGLILMEGADWVRNRKVINPAFSIDKLKTMIKKMADCTISMLDEWHNKCQLSDCGRTVKILVDENLQKVTTDIIVHTAFGTSFKEGKEAFEAQQLLKICAADSGSDINIPGIQYLPTPTNFRIWKLDKQVTNTLKGIVESRLKESKTRLDGGYGDDLLGIMIESSLSSVDEGKKGPKLSMDEIIEHCKTFFFAGQETTATLLTWAIFLLGLHEEWQERLREEVLRECGMEIPEAEMLGKLKLVEMVLLETLRLYSPVILLLRKATKDVKLGNLMIPKDTCISIPVLKIHRSKEYWGDDAEEFNPLRFGNGVSKATNHSYAFSPFGMGPRICIGQNFTMLEGKTILALILQRFSFSLSSDYKHAPMDFLTLYPQYGLPVNVKPLH